MIAQSLALSPSRPLGAPLSSAHARPYLVCMKILVVHNRYHYRGGEDSVVDAEVALLRSHGHQVLIYSRDNNELPDLPKAGAAPAAIWSRQTEREIRQIAIDFAPEVIYSHNTFPLISPSLCVVSACLRIPVVQTLHNFRLLCPQAMLLREGRHCEDCFGHLLGTHAGQTQFCGCHMGAKMGGALGRHIYWPAGC